MEVQDQFLKELRDLGEVHIYTKALSLQQLTLSLSPSANQGVPPFLLQYP